MLRASANAATITDEVRSTILVAEVSVSGFSDTREVAAGRSLSRGGGQLLSLEELCLDSFLLCTFCL